MNEAQSAGTQLFFDPASLGSLIASINAAALGPLVEMPDIDFSRLAQMACPVDAGAALASIARAAALDGIMENLRAMTEGINALVRMAQSEMMPGTIQGAIAGDIINSLSLYDERPTLDAPDLPM
ncbi:MAG TPA: hypothetical protein VGN95_25185 [Pyrinomonadaceae bacterium]|jgi:hypothetical protein|nr:hypothetical protein [Pyrinomonadaceae bacterium]